MDEGESHSDSREENVQGNDNNQNNKHTKLIKLKEVSWSWSIFFCFLKQIMTKGLQIKIFTKRVDDEDEDAV